MNLIYHTEQQMLPYSQFASQQEFEDQIQRWCITQEKEFTRREWICFHQLLQSSKKVPGVCYKKINLFLVEIEEEQQENISRDTFKRMIRKAKRLGLLTVYKTVRENGSQTSNLYVFNSLGGASK